MQTVGPRLAANFSSKSLGPNDIVPGAGRGILGSMYTPTSEPEFPGPPRESVTPPPVGRGRGRGFRLTSD